MKRYKRILILAAVLVVACAATFGVTRYEAQQEQIRTSQEIILQIPSDSVQALSWEYSGGGSLAFRKTDSGWKFQDDEAFPVSEKKVLDILSRFEQYGVTFVIEQVTDYAQYGLDQPECILRLEAEEETYTLKMGAFSKMDSQRYIDIGDGNVYLVEEDPMEYVHSELSSMILHDDTPGFETVADITFSGSQNYTIVRTEESPDTYNPQEDLYFTEYNGKTVPLDSASVQQYLNTVTSLDLLEYVTHNATAEELQTYGLDAPLLSVTVNYSYTDTDEDGKDITHSETCTIHISENPEERAACDAAVANGDASTPVTKYVRVGDSQIVYTMDDVDFGILRAAAFDDLRHKEVFWGDFDTVTRMDIALEGETHTLTSLLTGEEEEQTRVWYYGEAPQSPSGEETAETTEAATDATEESAPEEGLDISGIQNALLALAADSFTQASPTEMEEIRLTLHLEDPNFPTVEIALYRHDGSFCLAAVDGSPVCLIPRSQMVALVEAVQAIVLNG